MYLMNVPPVAAIHTEWRTCGAARGFSQPLCFHDSDSDLSTTGTPIPEKVQMIIESLRGSQSSLKMGDETEGNVLSGQETRPPQGCKARRVGGEGGGQMAAGPRPKCRSLADTHLPETSSPTASESMDSDSDGSVDRGIEEAIQEYLKEKDGRKRKVEPASDAVQPSKIPKKEHHSFPENPKQHSESNKVSTDSNQALKSLRSESHAPPLPMHAVKKVSKSKMPLKENPFKRADPCKSSSFEQRRGPSDTQPASIKVNLAATVKLEEDSPDSSSDDGIEEAIKLYQMEKKEERQETQREACRPLVLDQDPDSSSDDGIEEAIRSYQLEKQKEMKPLSLPKPKAPSLPKQKPLSKVPSYSLVSSSTQEIKKHKLTLKKKKKTERDVKSLLSTSCPSTVFKSKRMSKAKGKGNGAFPSKMEPSREQRSPATLKVNTTTTAELMCAEAILDISKAVMPEVFNPNVPLAGNKCPESSSSSSFPVSSSYPDNGSDDSSVDSEDGIEQEIRMFLEQKAQMNKQVPGGDSATTPSAAGSDSTRGPVSGPDSARLRPALDVVKPAQKKAMRLSLSQKRKLKAEGGGDGSNQTSKEERAMDHQMKETIPKHLTECDRGASPSVSGQRDAPQRLAQSERREQSGGEKSSSLDSDEDLDTAIKDLLKTKKKLKRKTRDMKLKSRKGLKDAEAGNTVRSKELRAAPNSKPAVLKGVVAVSKCKNDSVKTLRASKNTLPHKQQGNKRKESLDHVTEKDQSKGNGVPSHLSCDDSQVIVQIKEDSSSVDSDDSIEQEIRKFLAEKAKVSTTSTNPGDGEQMGNSNAKTCAPPPPAPSPPPPPAPPPPPSEKSITLENQLAEIPKVEHNWFSASRTPPRISEQRRSRDGGFSPSAPTAFPAYPGSATNLPRDPCLSFAFSRSPRSLEPADGAGAARTDERRRKWSSSSTNSDSQNTTPERAKCGRPVPGLSALPPSADRWRESLSVPPTPETKDKIQSSASTFHTTALSPNRGETTKTTFPSYVWGIGISHRHRSPGPALDRPVSVCPPARSSRPIVPFHCSAEPPAATNSRLPAPPTLKLARQSQGSFFMRGVATGGHWGQLPMPELSQSVVRMARDQSTFVELSPGKTSHVQVRSKGGASEGMDSPPGERESGRERGQTGRTQDCVDETDTDEVTSPEKKQGHPTLSLSMSRALSRAMSPKVSLSTSISPGVLLSPYIALNTEERARRFHERCLALKQEAMKSSKVLERKGKENTWKGTKKLVKRKLQFLPSSRINGPS